jgi:hypothetical protein
VPSKYVEAQSDEAMLAWMRIIAGERTGIVKDAHGVGERDLVRSPVATSLVWVPFECHRIPVYAQLYTESNRSDSVMVRRGAGQASDRPPVRCVHSD